MSASRELSKNNILILGGRGFGKTCALASMYRTLSIEGVAGYQLHIRDNFDFAGQEQKELLNALGDGITEHGVLPDASVQGIEFHFYFTYGSVPIMEINWLDYPGSFVQYGKGKDRDGEDYEKFVTTLVNADLVVLCIPADELMNAHIMNNTTIQAYYSLITEAVYNMDKAKRFLISYMVTKADGFKKEDIYCRLSDVIKESAFYQAKKENWKVTGYYCTLGKELKFMPLEYNKKQTRIDPKTYDPTGFDLAIYLVASRCIYNEIQFLVGQIETWEKEIQSRENAIREIKGKWRYILLNVGTMNIANHEIAIRLLNEQAAKNNSLIKAKKEHLSRLTEILDQVGLLAYCGGSLVKICDIYK